MAPKYERIITDLRKKIREHELSPGEQLPSQTVLAEQHKVSVPTVQQALGVLEDEGMIDSIQGIGTYVRAPRKRLRRTVDRYQWEKSMAVMPLEVRSQSGATERDTGLAIDDLDFHAEYHVEDAPEDLAKAFGQGIAALVLHKTSVDISGRVVEISDVVLPGDRTIMVYEKNLERWPES